MPIPSREELEKTLRIVSWSELTVARECMLEWKWKYPDRWQEAREWGAPDTGHVWDAMMNAWYAAIQSMQSPLLIPGKYTVSPTQVTKLAKKATLAVLKQYYDKHGLPKKEHGILQWMLDGYIARYGIDPQWRVMAIQYDDIVPLAHPGRDAVFGLRVIIDLVVWDYDKHGLYLPDHKSTRYAPKSPERSIVDFNDQFPLYAWAMRQRGEKVLGSIWSGASTYQYVKVEKPLDERFARTPVYYEDDELEAIAQEALSTMERAYSAENLANPTTSPHKVNGKWCPYCPFKSAHRALRRGQDPTRVLVLSGMTQRERSRPEPPKALGT